MSQESETLQNLRNRRESARLNPEWRMPLVDDAIAYAANLERQVEELKAAKHARDVAWLDSLPRVRVED